MKERPELKTVAFLKRELSVYPDDYEVDFSGLDFYRFKRRGPGLVQCEFAQTVYRTAEGRVVVENHEPLRSQKAERAQVQQRRKPRPVAHDASAEGRSARKRKP